MLFCAGRGNRLRPISDRIAKPALPLLDVPVAAFGLHQLLTWSAPVIVNVSHLGDTVVGSLEATLGRAGAAWQVLQEPPEAYGTAGTLAALENVADTIIVYNGDLLSDIDVEALKQAHESSRAAATLVVREVDRGADVIVEDDRVEAFIDRRAEPGAAGHMYLGVAALSREVIASIPKKPPLGLGESVFAPLVTRRRVNVMHHRGYALDVGTPRRFVTASIDLLSGRGPLPPVPYTGRLVEVEGGRAYIGKGALAPMSALRHGAVVLSYATVEEGADLKETVVWPWERVPAGAHMSSAVWFDGQRIPLGD
ncbi:MAG: nucleotidyltransferase family protein [Actinomycetota bacterium]